MISYEEAVKMLKELELSQKGFKRMKYGKVEWTRKLGQSAVEGNKHKINVLLSLVKAHKQARRFYGVLKDVQSQLGMSSKERELVDKVLNEKK